MKRKRHTPEQIVKHLRDVEAMQGAGKTIEDACRQIDVSVQTYYGWKKRFGGMTADEHEERVVYPLGAVDGEAEVP